MRKTKDAVVKMTDRLNPEAFLAAKDAGREAFQANKDWHDITTAMLSAYDKSITAYLAALPEPRTITTVEEIPATIQVISWEEEPEHECWKLSPNETFVGLIVKSGRSWSPADQYTLRVERTPTEGGGE